MAETTATLITLEEHWLSKHVQNFYASQGEPDPYSVPSFARLKNMLEDIDDGRVTDNDRGMIRLQVLSHAPLTISLDAATCIAANNELAQVIRSHPDRYRAFAMLPMAHPIEAAKELERTVTELGFLGALIDNTTSGRFYDDASFWPVFSMAQDLDVPIYLHPSYNANTRDVLYKGNYPTSVARSLATNAWGWHTECGTHFLRLYAAGVFDQFPQLRLVLGHMGEMLPFQLDRIIHFASAQWPNLQRPLRQVWDENVWITTSGMFSLSPAACLLRQCKLDRIIYSVDYPFASNEAGLKLMKDLETSGLVDKEQLEAIGYKNAEALLKI
ncbi:hypothetical protein B0A52_00292 [Exophiala mesophila]|uniref:Amidohydrolase-related domain-containing protein n=1 Tax=Exophiala mesophila TaxID=212818 RepID=A0A438NJP4_EXOME|nr:hypothetical protein B0A52_00292 [Exophiala mesophila]